MRSLRSTRRFGFVRRLSGLLLWISATAELCAQPPLHFVFEDYPPYEYVEQGQVLGIHLSILREVAQRLQLEVRFEALPWLRALHMAEVGEVDGIFSLFQTEERDRFLLFPSQPLSMETNVLFTARQHPVLVRSPEDLRGKSVGVVAGNAYGEWFDSADWIDKQAVTGSERLLLKQADGRTDLSVSNAWVARFLIDKLQIQDRIRQLDFVVSEAPLYIGFPRAKGDQSERLARQFSETLQSMRAEGRIDAIIAEQRLDSPMPAER